MAFDALLGFYESTLQSLCGVGCFSDILTSWKYKTAQCSIYTCSVWSAFADVIYCKKKEVSPGPQAYFAYSPKLLFFSKRGGKKTAFGLE